MQKIDESKLTKEQKQVLKVFKDELEQAEIKGIDLNDLYILEQGTRKAGAKKILVKHYGVENTGGLTNEELLNMGEVIKNGSVLLESFEKRNNGVRYAYEWDNNGVKLSLVVDDLNDGNKIFDFYSDRNFIDFRDARPLPSTSKDSRPLPTTLNEPNFTQKPLTSQEVLLKTQENTLKNQDLSPLEQANAEKLAKLESEKLESEKEFTRLKEQEIARKAALKKKLEHERGNAGNIESQTKIEVGEDIPTHTQVQIPKSRVRLNEREIYDLDYAIVKAKDLKPSFTTGGTQKRTDMNEEQIKSIAQNFDPKKIFGSGGFEDLPIILHDGQVIAGNHRVQGMLNFAPKSRYLYERAIKEYYHIDLKPDELLVRVPHNRLNNTEINNLAASSNQGRFNSESDHAIAVLSHYEPKLKELEKQLNADSIYSLKNIVAKNLNFDKATHPNVTDSNLALLMFNMPRTKTQGIELLNRWQKEFSNDIKSYEKVKKMFVDNAGSFHNLIHDMSFPNVSLNAYLSDIMDRSFANLKNYPSASESLKDLSEKFYKTNSLEMFEKSDQKISDISEILGASVARFARFDDPSKALFEALKSDNIKKGLKEFKIADVTKDMFDPNSKEFKDIDIYNFTHYLLMVNREPNENNPSLNRLIQAVKDMQKEAEKLKEASKKNAKETEKGIKRDYSDTHLNADEVKKLIDESPRTGSSMPILEMQNLNAEAVEYIQKNHKRIAVEKIDPSFAKDLKLKYPDDARSVIDYQAINHILKEHKNLSYEDIANYRELSKQANETLKLKDNQNRPVVASFNQINGFFVVVEQVSNAKNELMLKTMYKERENYKDSLIYKKTLAKS
ncbi:putative [Helicobacter pylori]|nr:putative [Helicobacter pylori]